MLTASDTARALARTLRALDVGHRLPPHTAESWALELTQTVEELLAQPAEPAETDGRDPDPEPILFRKEIVEHGRRKVIYSGRDEDAWPAAVLTADGDQLQLTLTVRGLTDDTPPAVQAAAIEDEVSEPPETPRPEPINVVDLICDVCNDVIGTWSAVTGTWPPLPPVWLHEHADATHTRFYTQLPDGNVIIDYTDTAAVKLARPTVIAPEDHPPTCNRPSPSGHERCTIPTTHHHAHPRVRDPHGCPWDHHDTTSNAYWDTTPGSRIYLDIPQKNTDGDGDGDTQAGVTNAPSSPVREAEELQVPPDDPQAGDEPVGDWRAELDQALDEGREAADWAMKAAEKEISAALRGTRLQVVKVHEDRPEDILARLDWRNDSIGQASASTVFRRLRDIAQAKQSNRLVQVAGIAVQLWELASVGDGYDVEVETRSKVADESRYAYEVTVTAQPKERP